MKKLNNEQKIIEQDLKACFSKYGNTLCYIKQRFEDEKDHKNFEVYSKQITLIFKKFNFKVAEIHKDFHIALIHKIGAWCTDIKVKNNGFSYGFSQLITKQ